MLQFVLLMLALAQPAVADRNFGGLDPRQDVRPVTDKDVLGMPAPMCADRKQEQLAMEQRIKGWTPECVIRPRKRNRDGLDQSQPHP